MCERECFCVILENRVRGLQTRGKGEPHWGPVFFPGPESFPEVCRVREEERWGWAVTAPFPGLCSQEPQDRRGWPLLPSPVSLQLTGTEDNPEVWRVGTWHSGVVGARPGMVRPGAERCVSSPFSWLLPVGVSFLSVPLPRGGISPPNSEGGREQYLPRVHRCELGQVHWPKGKRKRVKAGESEVNGGYKMEWKN